MYPTVRVQGSARERGRQYGEQARTQIHRSIAAYEKVFEHYARWPWSMVTKVATDFLDPIEEFGRDYLDEMSGIAEGGEVAFEDILAINLRTEVMFAAKARQSGATLPRISECSSFASVSPDGRVLIGQNWDWLPHVLETVVVVEARRSDGPSFVTIVEAGLLAKCGLNSAGLGLATNALVCDEDIGKPGVPYHVMLRALLDCESMREGLDLLQSVTRSSSANYLLAHRSGLALDVEARPGGFSQLHLIQPDDRGVILHTNHFASPDFDAIDVGVWAMSDTPFRMQRLARGVRLSDPGDLAAFERLLTDHAGYPDSICCHPNPKDAEVEQGITAASFLADLTDGSAKLSSGPPCMAGFEDLNLEVLRG